MGENRISIICVCTAITTIGFAVHIIRKAAAKATYTSEIIEPIPARKPDFYEKYIKQAADVIFAAASLIIFSPLFLIIAALVKIKLGSPVFFAQYRPGIADKTGKETIFKIYKFRTMTDVRDEQGNLLPDEMRSTKFGARLRAVSLDELPELFNIINGTMSFIGPRPQLVRDMTFMTKEQRIRHTAKPGLSGLAQINGRSVLPWKDKFEFDKKYINKISLAEDIRIALKTFKTIFTPDKNFPEADETKPEDFGDYLLRIGEVDQREYEEKLKLAEQILKRDGMFESTPLKDYSLSVSMCVYKGDMPDNFDSAIKSIIEQTVKPREIALTVDGPIPDCLEDVINKYTEQLENSAISFKVSYLKENAGHGSARNDSLNNCSYELVALMDSDDISVPDRFEQQLSFIKNNPDCSAVGGYIHEFIDTPAQCTGVRVVPETDADIKKYMKKRCPMNQVTVMLKKSDVFNAGGYINWYCEEDYYLWLRMALKGCKFGNIPKNLVNVRIGPETYHRRGGIKYYQSEIQLQKYMLEKKFISFLRYNINVIERLILQVLMPDNIRGFVFKSFIRKHMHI